MDTDTTGLLITQPILKQPTSNAHPDLVQISNPNLPLIIDGRTLRESVPRKSCVAGKTRQEECKSSHIFNSVICRETNFGYLELFERHQSG